VARGILPRRFLGVAGGPGTASAIAACLGGQTSTGGASIEPRASVLSGCLSRERTPAERGGTAGVLAQRGAVVVGTRAAIPFLLDDDNLARVKKLGRLCVLGAGTSNRRVGAVRKLADDGVDRASKRRCSGQFLSPGNGLALVLAPTSRWTVGRGLPMLRQLSPAADMAPSQAPVVQAGRSARLHVGSSYALPRICDPRHRHPRRAMQSIPACGVTTASGHRLPAECPCHCLCASGRKAASWAVAGRRAVGYRMLFRWSISCTEYNSSFHNFKAAGVSFAISSSSMYLHRYSSPPIPAMQLVSSYPDHEPNHG
jgi:hypothetical protein